MVRPAPALPGYTCGWTTGRSNFDSHPIDRCRKNDDRTTLFGNNAQLKMEVDEPIVRRYSLGEEAALWRICFEATWHCIGRDYHADLCERWAPHDKDMAEWAARVAEKNPFVAVVEGYPVAFAELEPDGHIDYFYCLSEWQGRRIGKALLCRIEEEAQRLGLRRL